MQTRTRTEERPTDRPSDDRVEAATGKRWEAWFSLLDAWGAKERKHGETAAFLMEEDAVPGWWAQSITVFYQRARGLRRKHEQADGFAVSASKTIAAPGDRIFEAFVKPAARRRWLADGTMSLRTSQPGRTARFDWEDGATRVNVSLVEKGPGKMTVAVSHERLPDPDTAERAKVAWRARLVDLASYLGGTAGKPKLLAGGNPQIPKGDGDAPVQAYLDALPGWKREVGRRLDALVVRTVPEVRKAVRWNSPFYGVEGRGWFLSFHAFTGYLKLTFFRGTSLRPVPPGAGKHDEVRYLDIREDDALDEARLASWVKQAAALPGWIP